MHRIIFSLLLLCVYIGLAPEGARALDIRPGMEISESLVSKTNYLDRGVLAPVEDIHFSKDTTFNVVNVFPTLSVSLGKGIDAHLQGDFYTEHHFDDVENDDAEAVLAGAYLSLHNRRTLMDIGIQQVQFGNGRILTDDAPAVDLKVDVGDAYINFMAARALGDSPLFGITFGYTPGFLEHFSLYGVWFQDGDDVFAQSIPLIYQVLFEPESEGDLYWIGVSADLFIGKALFSMVGAYQTGRIALSDSSNRREVDVKAFYGELALEANLTATWSAGAFCIVASGDDAIDDDLTSFISVQSYNPRAAIFFDPDFLENDDSERYTFGSGPFGGVIAPGLSMSYAPAKDLRIDATVVTFHAHEALEDGSRWYGWEADLALEISLGRYYTVYARAARFWHGDYYDAVLDEANSPATRLVMGLSADF